MFHCRCPCQGQTRLPGQILDSRAFNQFCYCKIRPKGLSENALENTFSLLITQQNEMVKKSEVLTQLLVDPVVATVICLHLLYNSILISTLYGKLFVDT